MKLLLVIPEWEGGGIGTYYRMLVPELARQGIRMIIACSDHRFVPPIIDGVDQWIIPKGLYKAQAKAEFTGLSCFPLLQQHLISSWGLYYQIQAEQPKYDLVEVSDYPVLAFPWLYFPRSKPVLVTLHGSIGQLEYYERRHHSQPEAILIDRLEQLLFSRADELIALSTLNATYWARRLGRKVAVIPPFFNYPEVADGLGSIADYGLTIGRVQSWKGVEQLCKAAEQLGDNCPPLRWVGGDNYFRNHELPMTVFLEQNYSVWNTRIRYLGHLCYPLVQQQIASAKFIVVPSIWDTFNFTVIEAMRQGKTVICSDGVGAAEHIIHGVNGFIYSARDIGALSQLLIQVGNMSKEQLIIMGGRAKESVLHTFCDTVPVLQRLEKYGCLLDHGVSNKKSTPEDAWLLDILDCPDQTSYLLRRLPFRLLFEQVVNRFLTGIRHRLPG